MRLTLAAALLAGAAAVLSPASAAAQGAHTRYTGTLARERALRDAAAKPTLKQIRAVVDAYEAIVRRYPSSGYTDNALWQAANVALLAHDHFGDPSDRRRAVQLLKQLAAGYPTSSLVPQAKETLARLETRAATPQPPPPPAPAKVAPLPVAEPSTQPAFRAIATIRDIKRSSLPDGVRITIEMDSESIYRQERLENPARVFFDLKGTRATPALHDATLRFTDDVVREIRLGRHPQNTTRVVMDMQGVEGYSIFTLYDPFRLVVDFRRAAEAVVRLKPDTTGTNTGADVVAGLPLHPDRSGTIPSGSVRLQADQPGSVRLQADEPGSVRLQADQPGSVRLQADEKPAPVGKLPLASRPVTPPSAVSPALPRANSDGRYSLARQLGLGISRIVLDPGHGGHDPGARGNGLTEAQLVLDVALRLRKLLEKQTNIEVTMTREADVFVPLEERTAIANREGADLFLSIHANASVNSKARGVETYFLNFASNPEAEAVAARENSAAARTMHSLPDIVRAIALNNKIDESRDFARMVQKAMVRRLAARNRQLRDLGVKQAPFVVLIGAGMPSVLAEISFITNKQEGQLLKTAAYRQHIAEALFDAVLLYQQSLKNVRKVASRQP